LIVNYRKATALAFFTVVAIRSNLSTGNGMANVKEKNYKDKKNHK